RQRSHAGSASVSLTPLPLYVLRDGQLCELIDLVLADIGDLGALQVQVTIGEHHYHRKIPPAQLGDRRIRLSVPAFDQPTSPTAGGVGDSHTITWSGTVTARRRWTVHVIPHVHLDVGYTDYQAKVIELHNRNVERALAICRNTPDYAFSIDGS